MHRQANTEMKYSIYSMDNIVVTMKYQSVPVPGDLIEPMNKNCSSNNKILVDHFDIEQSIVWEDYSNNNEYYKYEIQTPNNNNDNSEDGDTDELDTSQHLNDLISDKIVNHED